jgi:hypothetical protein
MSALLTLRRGVHLDQQRPALPEAALGHEGEHPLHRSAEESVGRG